MTTTSVLNLGVIGVGRIGALHTEHVTHRIPEAQVAALADTNADAARTCAVRNAIPQWTTNYREVLESPEIGAVLICTPTTTHADIIEDAATAQKHIFVEKPLALAISDIDRALRAAADVGVRLQVGFQRRFDPTYRRVYDAIQGGEIGELHVLRMVSRDPNPPPVEYLATCGGLFLDMTIHDFDMARFLANGEVARVYAVGAARIDAAHGAGGDIDTALITLEFENGVFASIDNSRQALYGYDQRVEAFGSRGSIESENHYPNEAVLRTDENIRRDLPLNFFMDRYIKAYTNEVASFVRAVTHGGDVQVTGADGRMAVAVALAAKRSLVERRPVDVTDSTA